MNGRTGLRERERERKREGGEVKDIDRTKMNGKDSIMCTLAPQTNEKWILGSHDFIANTRLGSP